MGVIIFSLTYSLFKEGFIQNKFHVFNSVICLWYLMLAIISINNLGIFHLLSSVKISSFYWNNESNRIFNACFQPTGAYSGGEGNFWITESPIYIPIIEKTIYYKHAILWDFGVEEFDGKSVNQSEIVKSYIIEKVISD